MFATNTAKIRLISAAIGLALLAGCVTPPPPPPPPPPAPPPPVVKVIPPRPTPPNSSALGMYIPPRATNGRRQTVNFGLSNPQRLWNVRSAINVAALNCLDPKYAGILPAYRKFLERHRRKLKQTNDTIVARYRAEYGRSYRPEFDGYMTQVYNYYALPPAQTDFCNTMLAIANDTLLVQRGGLDVFARTNMPRIERVFDRFYTSYEKYQVDVVAWDAAYAPPPSSTGAMGFGQSAPSSTTAPIGPATGSAPVIYSVDVPASEGAIDPIPSPAPSFEPQAVPADSGVAPGFSLTPPASAVTFPAAQPRIEPNFVSEPVVQPMPSSGSTVDSDQDADQGSGGAGNGDG